jgi:hypothetical protein
MTEAQRGEGLAVSHTTLKPESPDTVWELFPIPLGAILLSFCPVYSHEAPSPVGWVHPYCP